MSELHTPHAGDDRAPDIDVVALLMRQHGDIRNLFDEVEAATGDERRDAFRRLVRLLAVHETAEEEVVHSFARRNLVDGEQVVEDRLAEEKAAKEALTALDDLDTDDPPSRPGCCGCARTSRSTPAPRNATSSPTSAAAPA